ncbi:hypothetical protein B484DRAFT_421092 [Ochromonadaceae sp. CCMP2298]|nr:hypothetical protein B484DRAFT_421092 [Ochromonadaceae sp. CCMP2298]
MFGRPTGSRVLIIEDEGGKAGALSEQGTLTDLLNDPTAFLIGTALHPYTKELLEFSKHREISYFYLPPLSPSFLLASLTAANGQIKPEYLQHNLWSKSVFVSGLGVVGTENMAYMLRGVESPLGLRGAPGSWSQRVQKGVQTFSLTTQPVVTGVETRGETGRKPLQAPLQTRVDSSPLAIWRWLMIEAEELRVEATRGQCAALRDNAYAMAAGYNAVLKLLVVWDVEWGGAEINLAERLGLFLLALHIQRGGRSARRLLGDHAASKLGVVEGRDMAQIKTTLWPRLRKELGLEQRGDETSRDRDHSVHQAFDNLLTTRRKHSSDTVEILQAPPGYPKLGKLGESDTPYTLQAREIFGFPLDAIRGDFELLTNTSLPQGFVGLEALCDVPRGLLAFTALSGAFEE